MAVTGRFGDNDLRDLTATTLFESADPAIVKIENGQAIAGLPGTTEIIARCGDVTTKIPVTVKAGAQAGQDPISFKTELEAALTKGGCNMGACHGSPTGKGGFRLSLRGYDPLLDLVTLKTEFQGRRANLLRPDDSLILRKPLMEIAHAGGKRFNKGDVVWQIMRQWIAEGMHTDPKDSVDLAKIEVFPKQRLFGAGLAHGSTSDSQQLVVIGTFSDGSQRDLTPLTVFSSSAEAVATVSERGLIKKVGRGETTILARYLDKMDTSGIAFLENVKDFVWTNPVEFNFIDGFINAKLKQMQILPSDLSSEDEFIRRVYLDAVGRLPTVDETRNYIADQNPERRTKLIDKLLDSPEHASFWALKWADVLRVNTNKLTSIGVHKFNRWIFEGVLHDQPLDEFARELLTAKGSVFENPAAGYWRASREPTDSAETTAQLFLGVRMQCAKCHNHPFERWTQDNYYGIGAAFARIGRKAGPSPDEEVVFSSVGGEVIQPRTGKTMKVHLLMKGDVDVEAGKDRRQVFAQWLTAPENPFFARAAVNRIWGHVMGRGIVDPVDDFRDSNPPSNPQLLEDLAKQFVAHKFSRKWLIRTIMNSQAYQRSSRANRFNAEDEIYFSHAVTRMLSAEQLLDSICAVTGVNETYLGAPAGTRAAELAEPPADNYFLKVFNQPQREMACECERSSDSNLSQALQMINGLTVHNKLRDDNGRNARMVTAEKSNDEILDVLYTAAICRPPTTLERQAAEKHLTGSPNRRMTLEDIGWAILNSKEFLFQH